MKITRSKKTDQRQLISSQPFYREGITMKSSCARKKHLMAMFALCFVLIGYSCASAPPRPDMVVAPTPIMDNEGKYMCPYTQDGILAEWVDKALNDQLKGDVVKHVGAFLTDESKFIAPAPLMNNEGKYLCPYTQDGILTEWVDKAINVKIGATLGKHIGSFLMNSDKQEGSMFGGFFGGRAGESKGRELAIKASGGWEYIKDVSDMSFDNIDDMAVYLFAKHSGHEHYKDGLDATMTLYPELKETYTKAIKWAYIKSTSNMSFDNIDDMAVYLYAKYSTHERYKDGLDAAKKIYPELDETYSEAIKKAKTK